MMYNDVDSDLPPFNDQIDGDEIFLFSNTKTSSTGASFLNDDEDDQQLRNHHNQGATASSHHIPVDVDELLSNTNFLEQPHCDTTEDPLFWNCKDISDYQLNEIWPQNQLNLNGSTNLIINNNNINHSNNGNGSNNHHNNLNLNQPISLGPTTSLTNCNNTGNSQHTLIHNGMNINHQQPQLLSQIQQHSQHSIINIQQQQQQQHHQQLHQQNHGIATLISQPSQINQLHQQQQQNLQLGLQQNQIAHIHQLQNVLQSQQQQILQQQQQQQTGLHQPQQIIQHVDNFQNKWITLVASNDQFQTFNSIPPQQQQQHSSKAKIESTSVPNISDTSKKEVVAKLNKRKEKPTCLNCPYCKRSFSKNFDLQQHMRCHTGEKPFQCIVCGRGFAQKSNVKKHMQAHKVWPEGPNNSTTPTDECMQENGSVNIKNEMSSGTALGLSNDRKNDGNYIFSENRYSCSYCQYNGRTYFELKSHLTIHKREKVFKCIVSSCGKTFSGGDLQSFLDHVTGHKDLTYHCHLCSGQFNSLDEFGEHQKHHSSSAQMRKSGHSHAQNLSKSTTSKQQNQQLVPSTHLQPQQNQRQYNQQQSINSTSSHQVSNPKAPKVLNSARLKSNPKNFRCSKCMNRYTTQTALDHHLSISTHNFPCTECNKVFMCERYLRRHLNTHTAVQHVCTFCDKQFKTATYLKMHNVVHTGEKPFRCNQCEAAFNRRDKLSRHKLTHETVKKFKCPFRPNIGCTKEFNRPDKLKAHVLTHSGVRPHPCDSCSRTFSRLSRLREHKKLHHDSNNNNNNNNDNFKNNK